MSAVTFKVEKELHPTSETFDVTFKVNVAMRTRFSDALWAMEDRKLVGKSLDQMFHKLAADVVKQMYSQFLEGVKDV